MIATTKLDLVSDANRTVVNCIFSTLPSLPTGYRLVKLQIVNSANFREDGVTYRGNLAKIFGENLDIFRNNGKKINNTL